MRRARPAGVLTPTQKRRLAAYLIGWLTCTEIAALEGVSQQAVSQSLNDQNAATVIADVHRLREQFIRRKRRGFGIFNVWPRAEDIAAYEKAW